MKNFICIMCLIVLLVACDVQGVQQVEPIEKINLDTLVSESNTLENKVDKYELDNESITNNSLDTTLSNGISIKWKKRGKGEKLKKGDLIHIDYRNSLEDGTIYDGNHLIKKTYVPFFVGWNQQTSGWDIALKELRVGDEVEIFLPADFARGKKGIPGVVPPNSNNILYLHVKEKRKPDVEIDDIRIWVVERSKKKSDSIKFNDKVAIHYWVSTAQKPRFDNSYQRGEPFQLKMGDGNIVPGLYKALHFGRRGDKMMIHIPAKEAYGSKGLQGLVGPNEDLFYDLMVVDVQSQ